MARGGSYAGLQAPKHVLIPVARGALTPKGAGGWLSSSRTQKPASCLSSVATQAVRNIVIYKRKDPHQPVSSFFISLSLNGKTSSLLPKEDFMTMVIQVNFSLSGASPNRGFS